MGALYVVATPIGNLSDITLRAIETLKNVNLIAAEDTRTTKVLLEKYNIQTKLVSYHKFNEAERADFLIEKIINGENIALVSDAGCPLISDPGNVFVKKATENNIKVIPVGGISAVTTFLSSISRKDEDFKFVGFLPKTDSQIETVLKENKFENLVFYESPARIKETLKLLLKSRNNPKISIGRELTKKFEEIKTSNTGELIEYYNKNPLKGELVCLVHKEESNRNEEILSEKIRLLKSENFSLKDVVKILDITDRAPKNKVKELFLKS